MGRRPSPTLGARALQLRVGCYNQPEAPAPGKFPIRPFPPKLLRLALSPSSFLFQPTPGYSRSPLPSAPSFSIQFFNANALSHPNPQGFSHANNHHYRHHQSAPRLKPTLTTKANHLPQQHHCNTQLPTMARSKKADEQKQLAPAVQPHPQQPIMNGPGPAPIMAPAPATPFSNQQGRLIDVDNFIRVRDSVRTCSSLLPSLDHSPTHPKTPLPPAVPAPNPSIQHNPSPSSTTTFSTLTAAAATRTAPTSIYPHSKLSNPPALSSTPSIIHNCLIAAIIPHTAVFPYPLLHSHNISPIAMLIPRDHSTRSLTPDAIEYHLVLA